MDFSDDEEQLNEKMQKQSLNGDMKMKSDNSKGYFGNKITNCNTNLVQNLKVIKH